MKPLPCKCGRVPKVRDGTIRILGWRNPLKKHECTCYHSDCKVGMSFGEGRRQPTRNEAIEAWNKFITEYDDGKEKSA